jgi:micrococcal nuclease
MLLRVACLLLCLCVVAPAARASVEACGLHAYEARVTRVVDGDTVVADIDLGLGLWMYERHVRLAGIDAPELRGDEARQGAAARDALASTLGSGAIVICTLPDADGNARTDGFGRILAIVWRGEPNGYRRNINVWMVLRGYAVPSWKPRLLRDLLPGS